LAVAIVHACNIHNLRSEWLSEQKQAEAGIALCSEQGFGNILQQFRQHRGYALVRQGQTAEGIALIRDGMAASRATGAGLFLPYYLALLADACGQADRLEEGLSALAEAFALVERTKERSNDARLYQIEGELTLRQLSIDREQPSVQQRAEGCFHQSIEIARRQGAKAFELEAVTSLGRLWLQQEKKAEARQMLTEIYNWFTEGFETAGLKDAKSLIDEVSA
jgi:predicted ATPase